MYPTFIQILQFFSKLYETNDNIFYNVNDKYF